MRSSQFNKNYGDVAEQNLPNAEKEIYLYIEEMSLNGNVSSISGGKEGRKVTILYHLVSFNRKSRSR